MDSDFKKSLCLNFVYYVLERLKEYWFAYKCLVSFLS